MSANAPPIFDYANPGLGGESITRKTASGALLSFLQTVITKAVAIGSQVVLAWLLKPEEFGLAGLAIMAATFAGLLRDAGLGQVLIRRQRHFDRWANAAFWMSTFTGIVAGLLLAISAPFVRTAYKAPGITPLILMLAIASPLISLSTVPAARLQAEMRFRYLTVLTTVTSIIVILLSILLALAHCGAASLIVPLIVGSAIRAIALWRAGRFQLRLDPQFRRWRYLFNDSGWLFLGALFMCLVGQGDYMILGLRQTPRVVGVYFFAFSLATQVGVLTGAVGQVLQPALCRLTESPAQQVRAFVRAVRVLAILSSPICFLQVALAGPFVRLLFGQKWLEAIPVIQFLSAGYAIWNIGSCSGALMLAQGRFRAAAITQAAYAAVFLLFVSIGVSYGAAGVAAGVAIAISVMGAATLFIALRPGQRTWHDLFSLVAGPQLLAAVAVAVASMMSRFLPASRTADVSKLVLVTAVSFLIYIPLVKLTMPETASECLGLIKTFRDRFVGRAT